MKSDPNRDELAQRQLTVIVVAYNSEEFIGDTVEHLESVTGGLDVEILVIDNASSDGSAQRAREALTHGRVIRSEENLGFGRGANIALQQARGLHTLMMNDDVWPDFGCIEQMLAVASDRSVGLVGAKMVNSDGSGSFAVRTYLPGLRDEWERIKDWLFRRSTRVEYPDGDDPAEVGFLVCACVMGDTQLLRQVGGFSDAFFMYGEDIDLCRRLRSRGLRLITVPSAVAVHARETAPDRRIRGRDFATRILNARDTYYRIWIPRWERMLINLFRAVGPSDQPFRFRYHLPRAIWDGPSLRALRTPPSIDQKEREPNVR